MLPSAFPAKRGISWKLTTWRVSICEKLGTRTRLGGKMRPVAVIMEERRRARKEDVIEPKVGYGGECLAECDDG
jgi:hypothetical protein